MNAALTLAAEHDLAGRHDDAINALARATQNGDLDAMTELGKRLVDRRQRAAAAERRCGFAARRREGRPRRGGLCGLRR